jgi:hypothetical protein
MHAKMRAVRPNKFLEIDRNLPGRHDVCCIAAISEASVSRV